MWRILLNGYTVHGGDDTATGTAPAVTIVANLVHVCSLVWLGDALLCWLLASLPSLPSLPPLPPLPPLPQPTAMPPTSSSVVANILTMCAMLALCTGFGCLSEWAATETEHVLHWSIFPAVSAGLSTIRDSEELLQHVHTDHGVRVGIRTFFKVGVKCVMCGVLWLLHHDDPCAAATTVPEHDSMLLWIVVLCVGGAHTLAPIGDVLLPQRSSTAWKVAAKLVAWAVCVLFVFSTNSAAIQAISLCVVAATCVAMGMLVDSHAQPFVRYAIVFALVLVTSLSIAR